MEVGKARFLGWKRQDGTPDNAPEFDMEEEDNEKYLRDLEIGTVLELFDSPAVTGLYHYFLVGQERCYIRLNEVELLPEELRDLEDWM